MPSNYFEKHNVNYHNSILQLLAKSDELYITYSSNKYQTHRRYSSKAFLFLSIGIINILSNILTYFGNYYTVCIGIVSILYGYNYFKKYTDNRNLQDLSQFIKTETQIKIKIDNINIYQYFSKCDNYIRFVTKSNQNKYKNIRKLVKQYGVNTFFTPLNI
jgi:hypothetical protein